MLGFDLENSLGSRHSLLPIYRNLDEASSIWCTILHMLRSRRLLNCYHICLSVIVFSRSVLWCVHDGLELSLTQCCIIRVHPISAITNKWNRWIWQKHFRIRTGFLRRQKDLSLSISFADFHNRLSSRLGKHANEISLLSPTNFFIKKRERD